jgi:diadenosine tetraphosphate (Ap4A) HIT family hydrolase
MENCAFCNRNKEEIILETENFYITPSIGQIVEGYLLICSKKHFIGAAFLPNELFKELEELKEKVKQILEKNYITPIFFEHGAISSYERAGCCIEHLHLHAVPINLDIFYDLSKHFEYETIKELKEIKSKAKTSYIFYENNQSNKFLFHIKEPIPSQYLRQIIAARINQIYKWDWREYPGLEEFNKTLEKLKGGKKDG